MTSGERDDYFYCSAFDCPGEHPIPGMTCPDGDENDLPVDPETVPDDRFGFVFEELRELNGRFAPRDQD